jgi:hypothetical protein
MEEACAAVLEPRADEMWTISDDESDASTIGDDVGAVDEPLLDQYLNGDLGGMQAVVCESPPSSPGGSSDDSSILPRVTLASQLSKNAIVRTSQHQSYLQERRLGCNGLMCTLQPGTVPFTPQTFANGLRLR